MVQEAFLAAHLRLDAFEDHGPGSFGRWLSKILEHKIRDELRRHWGSARRTTRHETSCAEPVAALARDPTPSGVAIRREGRVQIDEAMASLSAAQRLVLRMAHEEGHSFAEIARRLGRNPDTIYKLYGRAASSLARRLSMNSDLLS